MLLGVLVVGVLSATTVRSAEEGEWTKTYDMSKMPACGGWFGKTTSGTVEDGILRIVDASSEGGEGHCFDVEWMADPKQEAIAEARIKVISSEGDAGVGLWVCNGVNEDGIQLHTDGFDMPLSGLKYSMNTTDDFHVYRVAIKGNDIKVYVDGALAVDGTGKFRGEAVNGRNVLSFGSGSSAAKGESLWDYVRFTSPMVAEMQTGQKPPEMEQVTVFREAGTYSVFPSLSHDPQTDKLSTSFRAGGPKSHVDSLGARSVTMVSTDGGKTWSEGEGIPGEPFKGPEGRLINVACKWWQEHPATERDELEKQGYYVYNVREGVVAICAGAYWSWSDDGGKTWEKKDIDMPFTADLGSGMNSLQLDDGTIVFPVYGIEKVGQADSSWVLRSTDYGQTWSLITVATHPDGKTPFDEPEMIECKSGRLLIVMRTGVGNDHLWQAVSDDRGVTWHDLKDTGVKGHPPDLLRLQDGRILLTYGYRHDPFGIRAVVSSDEGETWDLQHIWVLRDDGGGVDLGYPHSVQLKEGTVVTMYYFFEPGGTQYIACTRWRVP